GPGNVLVPVGTPLYGAPPNFNLSPDGVIGGGQIGYNWQFSPIWVVGIEADIQGSAQKDTRTCVLPCGTGINTVPTVVGALFPVNFTTYSIEQKLQWFGTVRGRLGYTNGPALFYVTGGLAYGEVQTNASVAGSATFLNLVNLATFAGSISSSTT